MSAVYEFPLDYREPFADPWYYPRECTACDSQDFTWVNGKWFCSGCKKEVPNE